LLLQVLAAVFGVPGGEAVLAAFTCRASTAGGARGTLYLSAGHVAFARDGAAGGGLVGNGGGAASGPPDPAAPAGAPLALIPLPSIRRCVRVRRRRSRGLAFFVAGEAEPFLFWGFEARKSGGGGWWGGGGGGDSDRLDVLATAAGGAAAGAAASSGDGSRDAAEASLRLHVMGDGSALDRSFRGLPPPGAAPGTPADRAWEARLAGGGGWGGAAGAWGALLLGPDGAVFFSDEAPPLYARYGGMVEARPASTARDWRLSADVTVAAGWAPLPLGAATAAAAGGGSLPPVEPGAPPPPTSKLHFAGLGPDGAAELVAELGVRMEGAKEAAAGAVELSVCWVEET